MTFTKRDKIAVRIVVSLVAFVAVSTTTNIGFFMEVHAEKSPYDSGYDHGCSDARIDDVDDRYINQDGKGPSNHTDEFMDGYNAGYDRCGGGRDNDDDGGNSNEQDQSQSQSSSNKNENENIVNNCPSGATCYFN